MLVLIKVVVIIIVNDDNFFINPYEFYPFHQNYVLQVQVTPTVELSQFQNIPEQDGCQQGR